MRTFSKLSFIRGRSDVTVKCDKLIDNFRYFEKIRKFWEQKLIWKSLPKPSGTSLGWNLIFDPVNWPELLQYRTMILLSSLAAADFEVPQKLIKFYEKFCLTQFSCEGSSRSFLPLKPWQHLRLSHLPWSFNYFFLPRIKFSSLFRKTMNENLFNKQRMYHSMKASFLLTFLPSEAENKVFWLKVQLPTFGWADSVCPMIEVKKKWRWMAMNWDLTTIILNWFSCSPGLDCYRAPCVCCRNA